MLEPVDWKDQRGQIPIEADGRTEEKTIRFRVLRRPSWNQHLAGRQLGPAEFAHDAHRGRKACLQKARTFSSWMIQ